MKEQWKEEHGLCHGIVGYYIGLAMKHYQNYDSYILET
jgi:hypothetical protein